MSSSTAGERGGRGMALPGLLSVNWRVVGGSRCELVRFTMQGGPQRPGRLNTFKHVEHNTGRLARCLRDLHVQQFR
jgi:hypothetical protein